MTFVPVDELIQFTGIRAEDLGFKTRTELETFLSARLSEIDALINQHTGRSWTDDDVPAGVRYIALIMARNLVVTMSVSRETPIVQIGDFRVRIIEPDIMTTAIKDALLPYKLGGATDAPTPAASIRMFRVRRLSEMPEETTP